MMKFNPLLRGGALRAGAGRGVRADPPGRPRPDDGARRAGPHVAGRGPLGAGRGGAADLERGDDATCYDAPDFRFITQTE